MRSGLTPFSFMAIKPVSIPSTSLPGGDRPAWVRYRADGSVEWESFWKEDRQYTSSKAKPCEGKTVEIDGVKYVLTPVD